MNRLPSLRSLSTLVVISSISLVLIAGLLVLAPPKTAAMVATFTVNSTLDAPDPAPGDGTCGADGVCTLRAAIMEANASTGANTINVPAGTYALTLAPADDEFNLDGANELTGDLDIQNNNLTIIGAGAGSTIINGAGLDRIFDVNNPDGSGTAVNVTLQGLRLTGGNAPTTPDGFFEAGGAIQFNGRQGATPIGTLTITNCEIQGNTAAGVGGGIKVTFGSLSISGSTISGNSTANASGGGVFYDGGAQAGVRSLQVNNSTISNNQATNGSFGSGGGLRAAGNANITIENNTFNANQAGTDGGGLALFGLAKSVNKNKITNNSAGNSGGGVFSSGATSTLAFRFNLVVGNTASAVPTSSGLQNFSGVPTVENDWWGCNQGPANSPCDRALGVADLTYLVLRHTATPNSITVNTSTTLQADFFLPSMGSAVGAADLVALDGRAVLFNNAALGTISGADPTINAGKAKATFTAGPTAGSGSADATVDHATVTALITITEAPQAPSVTSNPTDQTVCDGGTATFTASASGVPAPTVKWQVSSGGPFTDIPGATSTTLMFTATAADNGNQYRAVFTNASGSATTTAATLTVTSTATSDPPDQTVCKGATATFSTTASGIGPFHYAWTLDGLPFNGDSPSINVPTGSLSSGPHTITVTTSGTCGSAMQTAILTVGDPPVITLSTNTVSMWPPNHNYRTFNVSDFVASASGCDGDLTSSVVIASVSSDEAEDNPLGADGTTLNDIVIAPNCKSVQLRKERDGNLNGRVYTITFKVTDSQGNTTTATATVTVRVNQSGPAAVNGPGPGYTVNSLCP